jgi:hypothetical protein
VADIVDARDFLVERETYRAAFGDLRLDAKHDADVLPLEGLERRDGRGGAGGRVAAGEERNVLADDDARFFVVEREERRRRQDVGADLRLERAREESEVRDRPETGNGDRALHHAQREPLPDIARDSPRRR